MKKRILSILLALVMVIGMLPAAAMAADSAVPAGAVEITPENAEAYSYGGNTATYDAENGWTPVVDVDEDYSAFTIELQKGDVVYYELSSGDTGAGLYDWDAEEDGDYVYGASGYLTMSFSGTFAFYTNADVKIKAYLLDEDSGVPAGAVEITLGNAEAYSYGGNTATYDEENGWTPVVDVDNFYSSFNIELQVGDIVYYELSGGDTGAGLYDWDAEKDGDYCAATSGYLSVRFNGAFTFYTDTDVKVKAYLIEAAAPEIPADAVEITLENAEAYSYGGNTATYDAENGWTPVEDVDGYCSSFTIELQAGDVVYYELSGKDTGAGLYEWDGEAMGDYCATSSGCLNVGFDGTFAFYTDTDVKVKAYLLDMASPADIAIKKIPVPKMGMTLEDYWNNEDWNNVTVNGETHENWESFGDITFGGCYLLDSEKNAINDGDFIFEPGTYYIAWDLTGDGFDGDSTATANGVTAEVYRDNEWPVGMVTVYTKITVSPIKDIVIDGMPLPEAGMEVGEYCASFRDELTVNGEVYDDEMFGDVHDAGILLYDAEWNELGDDDAFAPGTYCIEYALRGEGFGNDSVVTVNGVAVQPYRNDWWDEGWVYVYIELNVPESGPATIVPFEDSGIPAGAVEITPENATAFSYGGNTATYDAENGWAPVVDVDEDYSAFTIELQAGDVVYYELSGEDTGAGLYDWDEEDGDYAYAVSGYLTVSFDGTYTFYANDDVKIKAYLLDETSGIPAGAVEITPENAEVYSYGGNTSTYDAENGWTSVVDVDEDYSTFNIELQAGDVVYYELSDENTGAGLHDWDADAGDHAYGAANGYLTVSFDGTFTFYTNNDVKVKAYLLDMASPADIVIKKIPAPKMGMTLEDYWNSEDWNNVTINGATHENWESFGDITFGGCYLLDSEKNVINDSDFVFTPGTYYIAWNLTGDGLGGDSTATANGMDAEVYRDDEWPEGMVTVCTEVTVFLIKDIVIDGMALPEAGMEIDEYCASFRDNLTVNGEVYDGEMFGDVYDAGFRLFDNEWHGLEDDDTFAPGTYYIEYALMAEGFGSDSVATANGAVSQVFRKDGWPEGGICVYIQLSVPENGPATIVPFVASTIIDEVEITLPEIVAGGDVPAIADIDLGSTPANVRYVEAFSPVSYEVSYDTFENGKVYQIDVLMAANLGYAFDEEVDIKIANPDTENLKFEVEYCEAWMDGGISMAGVSILVRIGDPTPYCVDFRLGDPQGSGEYYWDFGSGEYTLPECMYTAPAGKAFKAWKVYGDDTEYQPGDTITLTKDEQVSPVWELIHENHDGTAEWTKTETTHSKAYSCCGAVVVAAEAHEYTDDNDTTCDECGYVRTISGGGSGSGGSSSSSYFYSVNVKQAVNGNLYVSPIVTFDGSNVTILATPDEGYVLSKLIVTDDFGKKVEVTDKGEGKYTFTMPSANVTVEAVFGVENPFADVSSDAYYYDAVLWAVKEGITNGTSETTFSPDASCTRAQMVTFLWRAAGSPEPESTTCAFTDVDMNSYYGKAVLWAVEQGITNGTSETTFSPDATCTRAQMATFLCRMAEGKPAGSTSPFTDVEADQYYTKPVQWAVENGITNGTSETTFSPDATCTRAQMVTFLYRYFVK